jgi:hypothetical protein
MLEGNALEIVNALLKEDKSWHKYEYLIEDSKDYPT